MTAYVRNLGSYLAFEGMTWPNPDDPKEVGWRLVYGEPTKSDLLVASSVMSAYAHLVELPQRERNRRITQIREAAALSLWHAPADPGETP